MFEKKILDELAFKYIFKKIEEHYSKFWIEKIKFWNGKIRSKEYYCNLDYLISVKKEIFVLA